LLTTPAASKSDPLLDQLETELRVVTESLGLKPYQPPIPIVRVAAAAAAATATKDSAVLPAPLSQQSASPLLSPSSASLKQQLATMSADLKTEMAGISNSDAASVRASLSRQFSV
jgi:hypothetical protein